LIGLPIVKMQFCETADIPDEAEKVVLVLDGKARDTHRTPPSKSRMDALNSRLRLKAESIHPQ
jgi:hypothetical protein